MAEQVELLKHHADADAGALVGDRARRQRLAVVAKPRRRPPTRTMPESQFSRWLMQRSSVLLPEPLGPEQRHDLADPHRQIEPVEHGLRAVVLAQIAHLDRDIVARRPSRRAWRDPRRERRRRTAATISSAALR